MRIEDRIKRAGLELGFSHVGIAPVHDFDAPFTSTEASLLRKIARTKTLNPDAQSVICATLGFSDIAYPGNLSASVARAYLSRTYTPPANAQHGAQIEAFARSLEEMGLSIDRNQFNMRRGRRGHARPQQLRLHPRRRIVQHPRDVFNHLRS